MERSRPEEQLYAPGEDPREQDDLAQERSDVVERHRELLATWVDEHERGEDPLRAVADVGPAGNRAFRREHGFDGV